MDNVNRFAVCRDNYESEEEFWNALRDFIRLFLNANYIMTVRYDEKGFGIISVEYNDDDPSIGADYPYWLSPKEIELVEAYKSIDTDNT